MDQLTPPVLAACQDTALRISCRLSLSNDADDAARQLDRLTSLLATYHVFGMCHELRGAPSLRLAEVAETLPPLRLALSADVLGGTDERGAPLEGGHTREPLPAVGLGVGEELEAILSATDHVISRAEEAPAVHIDRPR